MREVKIMLTNGKVAKLIYPTDIEEKDVHLLILAMADLSPRLEIFDKAGIERIKISNYDNG